MQLVKTLINQVFNFFVYNVEAHMRANTQNVRQGEQETTGVGEGRKNSEEQRHEEICGRERDGIGWGTQGKQDGHYRDLQEGKQGI